MSVVSDYTALLYYPTSSSARWNSPSSVGTQTIITYSFTDTSDLLSLDDYDPYGATAYWSYSEAQRTLFREVLAKFEAAAGVKFVEIQGDSMINVFGANVSGVGGWANVAYSSSTGSGSNPTSNGNFVNAYQSMGEGAYGYQVNLHELGHAMGLKHPHTGSTTLDPSVDTQINTVMTYNISNPYVTELGVFDIQALQDIYGAAGGMSSWTITVDAFDNVRIQTSNASETILATDQNTYIQGYQGDDTLIGREGDDTLNGGKGNDTITGSQGADRVLGRSGNDLIIGDIDNSNYSNESDDKDRLFGQSGEDTIYGGRSDDYISGGGHNDIMYGNYGNDLIRGGGGDDTLYGGDGSDRLTGNSGADVFVFTNDDAYETDRITDFSVGEDVIDLSSFGFMTMGSLSITQSGSHTFVAYSNWFEIMLTNFTASTLTASDFEFV